MFMRIKRLLLLWGVIIFTFSMLISCGRMTPQPLSGEHHPIEPLVAGNGIQLGELHLRGRFSVLNPEMKVFSLSLSDDGECILFSSEARLISKLDDEGNLLWEIVSPGLPISAALAADGSFAAIGTEQGEVYYVNDSGRIFWEKSFHGRIEHLIINNESDRLLLSAIEVDNNTIYCLDRQNGGLLWELETGLLQDLFFISGERICYLEKDGVVSSLKAVLNGESIWEMPAQLAGFSADGTCLALYDGNELQYYMFGADDLPYLTWSSFVTGDNNISWLGLTENGQYLFAYSAFAAVHNNLKAYSQEGALLWEQKIPGGALLDVSSSGKRIVGSSWQEYSEDCSKVVVLDNIGEIKQEIEMASRIEKIALSGDGSLLVLAGNDGNLFILDIPEHQ